MESPHISDDIGNYVEPPGQYDPPHFLGDTSIEVVNKPDLAIDMGRNLTEFSRASKEMITGLKHGEQRSIFICQGQDTITKNKCEEVKPGAASRCTNMNCSKQDGFTGIMRPTIYKPPTIIKCTKCHKKKKASRSLCPCTGPVVRKPRGPRKSQTKSRTTGQKDQRNAGMKHKKSKRKRSKKSKRKRR